jgi:ankyrin repeat protein
MTDSRWLLLVLVALVACGCDGYSKEQRQEMERIRNTVSANPRSVNSPDSQGYTLLHLAVLNNYIPLLDWLKEHRADPNASGQNGDRPLHVAVISDHSSDGRVILSLLRMGADVNAANDYGDTPLHRAAYLGLTEKVRLLLKNKADVSRRALRGETPLLYAARPEGYPETVLALLEGGAEVNAADNFGMAPLHGAAMIGDIDVARVLIEKGQANVDPQTLSGYTPLHIAAVSGKADFVQCLLDKGANRELQDHDKLTPEERASRFPAVTYSNSGSQPVDTSAAVTILKTYLPKDPR